MNRFLKFAVLSVAAFSTTLTALPSAEAGDRWRHRHYHHGGNGDFVAAGILGLAVGALAAGIATGPRYDYEYYEPIRREPRPRPVRNYYVEEPEVVYVERYGLEPWTVEWYSYCEDRYRSFNPANGTFTGYDGVQRFCRAN